MPDGSTRGPADGLVMARSGLERVGLAGRIVHDFSPVEMLPAVGQGIVAVECGETDWDTRRHLARISDATSRVCADAEREVLWVLNGHCNSPIAGHATIAGSEMTLRAAVIEEDGSRFIEAERTGPAERPRELGRMVGLDLLAAWRGRDHRADAAARLSRVRGLHAIARGWRLCPYPSRWRTRRSICSTCAIGVSGRMPWPRLKISRPLP